MKTCVLSDILETLYVLDNADIEDSSLPTTRSGCWLGYGDRFHFA